MNQEASLVRIQREIYRQIATVFGLGFVSKAPGTLGSLAAIPLWYGFYQLGPNGYLMATGAVVLVGMWVSSFYVSPDGTEDASEIVIDEVAGFLIAVAWLPAHWFYVLAGFVLFRALDILKPYPISAADQNIKGGIGVMADDVLAGIATNIVLQVVYQSRVLPW